MYALPYTERESSLDPWGHLKDENTERIRVKDAHADFFDGEEPDSFPLKAFSF